ncbi:hypothetical protein [Kribbella sancticallisti]|uniref:hypothetical protein n=1 Tax=Kribbella sancticallisti TaxID=460087 RepID=UPI0031CF1C52
MSSAQGAVPQAVPTPPSWDREENRFDIKLPLGGASYPTFVEALACLATSDAELTLTASKEDNRLVQREWTGQCSATEFALVLADARRFVLQATYGDGSRLWFDSGGTDRWRWSTSGDAQDAAVGFKRTVKSRIRGRRFYLWWPAGMLIVVWLMYSAWSHELPSVDPAKAPEFDYTGPLWYTIICLAGVLAALIGMIAADWTGFGLSKRRYLRRLSTTNRLTLRRSSWRDYVTIGKLDVTNGVGAALVIGVVAGVLGVLIVGK